MLEHMKFHVQFGDKVPIGILNYFADTPLRSRKEVSSNPNEAFMNRKDLNNE
jgi:hypothetical protein